MPRLHRAGQDKLTGKLALVAELQEHSRCVRGLPCKEVPAWSRKIGPVHLQPFAFLKFT